jgi:regulatory protein
VNQRKSLVRKSKDSPVEARTYALKLLNYRSRSKKELWQKLKGKGFQERHINEVIAFLEETGLLNDEQLASQLLRYGIENKSLGYNGIKMFLLKRGIDKDTVNKTLQDHSHEMEVQAAKDFTQRKQRVLKNYPSHIIKRRICGMLQRRGFSSDIIYQAVKSL